MRVECRGSQKIPPSRFSQPSTPNSQLVLDPPERAVRAELGNLAGRFFADVNGNGDHAQKCPDKHECHQPGWNVADSQGAIEIRHAFHRAWCVEEYFR